MTKLLQFLDRLDAGQIHYVLGHFRESVNVLVSVPGAYWEVEFFADDHVDVEIFRSNGIEGDSDAALERTV
jgi:hypothetical protein